MWTLHQSPCDQSSLETLCLFLFLLFTFMRLASILGYLNWKSDDFSRQTKSLINTSLNGYLGESSGLFGIWKTKQWSFMYSLISPRYGFPLQRQSRVCVCSAFGWWVCVWQSPWRREVGWRWMCGYTFSKSCCWLCFSKLHAAPNARLQKNHWALY